MLLNKLINWTDGLTLLSSLRGPRPCIYYCWRRIHQTWIMKKLSA